MARNRGLFPIRRSGNWISARRWCPRRKWGMDPRQSCLLPLDAPVGSLLTAAASCADESGANWTTIKEEVNDKDLPTEPHTTTHSRKDLNRCPPWRQLARKCRFVRGVAAEMDVASLACEQSIDQIGPKSPI